VSYSNINTLKFGILYDNENRFGFPTKGRKISIILESSIFQNSEAKSFSKISLSYKGNATFGVHTIRPIFYFGFADKTLPSNEFFNLGGIESFYGLSENEERGRQLFRGSMEYQVKLPFDIFFDTFLTFRYDLGSVWEVPESIKFQSLKHGIGSSVGVNTPIGPAKIAVGEMFYFRKSPNSVIYGYPHLYFSIGVNI
jgi:outer membrane protein assembly factor BamA